MGQAVTCQVAIPMRTRPPHRSGSGHVAVCDVRFVASVWPVHGETKPSTTSLVVNRRNSYQIIVGMRFGDAQRLLCDGEGFFNGLCDRDQSRIVKKLTPCWIPKNWLPFHD
ncbi:hypothetical protein XAUB_30690 [Xanthomonas citri pv. aurantifolii str. ICPB 11122]|nr:hypothetical protein XAUB_30690 [Xanthomonas citri pv. aurantifolii str. ICPB 11122]